MARNRFDALLDLGKRTTPPAMGKPGVFALARVVAVAPLQVYMLNDVTKTPLEASPTLMCDLPADAASSKPIVLTVTVDGTMFLIGYARS